MGYRDDFFKANPGITIPGKRGKQYRCVKCGGFFPKSQIDVDHKIAKRLGGTDDLWNLQATCQHCNRSKGKDSTGLDVASSVVGAVANNGIEGLGQIAQGVVTQGIKDALGIKYKR